jgi:hypothetical protein
MRDVADKPALGRDQRFDLLRHMIKITAEVRDLIVSLEGRPPPASGEVSGRQLSRCVTDRTIQFRRGCYWARGGR